MQAAEGQQALVLDGPLDGFTAREVQGLSDSGREIDIPLLAGLALDELYFSGEGQLTRYQNERQNANKNTPNVVYLVKGQTPGRVL